MKELAEFVPKMANFEKYLCSKFEKGLTLEIRENMFVLGSHTLRAEKLIDERMSQGKFQKRKRFGFVSG